MVGFRLFRRPAVRLFGLAWFLSLAFNVGAIHDCASAHAHHGTQPAVAEAAHHGHSQHLHEPSPENGAGTREICDCLGQCCASAVAAVITGSTTVAAVEAIATPPKLPGGDDTLLPGAPDHLHPPSTAPPTSLVG